LNGKREFSPYSVVNKKNISEIVRENMNLLENSDCVIVDLSIKNHLYIGCIDEMVCANHKKIFVIVICGDSGAEKHLYTNYRANKIVKNLDEAVEYINILNKELIRYEVL
jgi:anaerobic glycerol-3-phosphate dehydrogenase